MTDILLDGGISLPYPPRNAVGFKRPDDISERRWRAAKPDMWKRAYTHCLYSLMNLHDKEMPLHTLIPRISLKMLEATSPHLVTLRFMGEMELAGYIKFDARTKKKGNKDEKERFVVLSKKLINADLASSDVVTTAIRMPKIVGEETPNWRIPISKGIAKVANQKPLKVVQAMADEQFVINRYIHNLIKEFPPLEVKATSKYMLKRMLATVEFLKDKAFRFPYFADSRSRMYVDTTVGLTTQGADYEKAIIQPVYAEPLTLDGYKALLEAAEGYSELGLSPNRMAAHARDPKEFESEWREADKPYMYMAYANMIRMYHDNPEQPIPAFIPLDGRCSGLQHTSALARASSITQHIGMDAIEAELDIYEYIAQMWEDTLSPDMKYLATRKATKIPTMTWAYNATRMTSMEHMHKLFGAKQEWDKELCEYKYVGEGLEKKDTARIGVELFDSLGDTLGDLQEVVDWLSDCATMIAKSGNASIEWVTPDGFRAVQRKVKGIPKALKVKLSDGKEFKIGILDFSGKLPNIGRHRSSMSPNIVHSLDATHLRMVARALESIGLPMIFIHDSFSTHVNYRKALYKAIVDTFAELYSGNYLADLELFWRLKYMVDLPGCPAPKDWKPESIKTLDKFFI